MAIKSKFESIKRWAITPKNEPEYLQLQTFTPTQIKAFKRFLVKYITHCMSKKHIEEYADQTVNYLIEKNIFSKDDVIQVAINAELEDGYSLLKDIKNKKQ